MNEQASITIDFGKQVSKALAEESDRACVILVTSWADHLLRIRLAQEFAKGNADARGALFATNGPFATLSSKLNAVFCAGWLDRDVYHDLNVIRKMRNQFAHSIEPLDLHNEPFPALVAALRVPKREYHDWGELRAAAIENGVVLFTGERPSEAKEDIDISKITFRMAASVIVAVLVANLKLPLTVNGATNTIVFELPEHMREIPE